MHIEHVKLLPVTWMATREYNVNEHNTCLSVLVSNQPIILQAFHSDTKELLSSYGPFNTKKEFQEFVTDHNITL